MKDFYSKVIDWYDQNERSLPWRLDKNPYNVWLSEIILQQTRVDQGLAYYNKFILNYPTIFDLAKASEDDVLKLWEGLGYYSRGRNLLATAQYLVKHHKGEFPNTAQELLKLKGIGPYTSAAISSISNNEKIAAVDGNVFRVLSRVFNIDLDISSSKTRKYFELFSLELIKGNRPGDYNQALMDLGALVCKPKQPDCINCPLQMQCESLQLSIIDKRPVKSKKIKITDRNLNFIIVTTGTKLLIQKRKQGIWKGLYQLPLIETDLSKEELLEDEFIKNGISTWKLILKQEKPHKLSHQNLFISYWLVDHFEIKSNQGYQEIEIQEIPTLSWPKPLKEFLENQFLKINI